MLPRTHPQAISFYAHHRGEVDAVKNVTAQLNAWLKGNPLARVLSTSLAVTKTVGSANGTAHILLVFDVPEADR